MSVSGYIGFDPTDANSLAASANIGAYVRAGTDGDLIGSETLNSLEWLRVSGPIIDSQGNEVGVTSNALDVNIAAASGLAIFAEDSAHSSGQDGQHVLAVRQDTLAASTDTDGDYSSFKVDSLGRLYVTDGQVLAELQGGISIDDGGGSITVDAVDLDIRDLSAAQDNVAISDGTDTLAINADGSVNITDNGGSITVDATQLDIDDLNATDDAVSAWLKDGSGTSITSTGGALDVNIASGDIDDDLANTAMEHGATSVTSTAGAIATPLANRKHLFLHNEGSSIVYLGKDGTVTSSTGFPLYKNEKIYMRLGASLSPFAVTAAGTGDLRRFEAS